MSWFKKKVEKHEQIRFKDRNADFSLGYVESAKSLLDSDSSVETKKKWVNERFEHMKEYEKEPPKNAREKSTHNFLKGYLASISDYKKEQNKKGLNIYGQPIKKK